MTLVIVVGQAPIFGRCPTCGVDVTEIIDATTSTRITGLPEPGDPAPAEGWRLSPCDHVVDEIEAQRP